MEIPERWADRLYALGAAFLSPVLVVLASRWFNRAERATAQRQQVVTTDTAQSSDQREWVKMHLAHLEAREKELEEDVERCRQSIEQLEHRNRLLVAENLELYRRLSGDNLPRRGYGERAP